MKKMNKKGFTIVELVIVIAVVAILAAVLIPTFIGLVNKANESADIQAVRQMNTALVIAGELEDIDAVIDALAAAGYNSEKALIPVTSGYAFYWYESAKQIVLVNDKNEVVFPNGIAYDANGKNLGNNVQYLNNAVAGSAEDILEAITDGSEYIKFEDDIALTEAIEIAAGKTVTLDLNGKTLSGEKGDLDTLCNFGTMTIIGGTLESESDYIIFNAEGASLTLKDVTVKGDYAAVSSQGDVTIDGGTYDGAVAVEAQGGSVVINDGTFTNTKTDNTSNMLSSNAVVATSGSDVVINGGTFTASEGEHIIYAELNGEIGTLVINGGTFVDGEGIYSSGAIEINNGIFNCKIEAIGLNIVGGTFNEKIYIHTISSDDPSVDDRDIVISGGNFTYGDGQLVADTSVNGTISGGTFNTTKDKLFEDNDFVYVDIDGGSFKAN